MGQFTVKGLDYLVSLASLVLLAYFGWHAFYGPRGFAHHDMLALQTEKLGIALKDVTDQKVALLTRVTMMRPESVDPDLLDELVRRNLNYGKSDDIIVNLAK